MWCVCEEGLEPDSKRYWFSPVSSEAHPHCVKALKRIEALLRATIQKESREIIVEHASLVSNQAHIAAIKAVQAELGEGSIKSRLDAGQAKELKKIFDSSGVEAAKQYLSNTKEYMKKTPRGLKLC